GLTNGTIALAIDPSTPRTLYAATSITCTVCSSGGGVYSFGVYKSTDAGATWGSTGLTNTFVNALAIDPLAPSTLYAGTGSGGIFKSTDAGATWRGANAGLTSSSGSYGSVAALAIDPSTPRTL